MTLQSIQTNELLELANKSADKESYMVLQKTEVYRIGVGGRATSPNPSFFIEVIVNLSNETKKVDLAQLENILGCLRMLQTRKYSLAYEDNNYVQCEITVAPQDLNEEYLTVKSLLETRLG